MKRVHKLTCWVGREGDGYVSHCPEFDVASQGDSIETAKQNLIEAVELFLEAASDSEVQNRLGREVHVTPIEVSVG